MKASRCPLSARCRKMSSLSSSLPLTVGVGTNAEATLIFGLYESPQKRLSKMASVGKAVGDLLVLYLDASDRVGVAGKSKRLL
mgnify:CR=1 FL=1